MKRNHSSDSDGSRRTVGVSDVPRESKSGRSATYSDISEFKSVVQDAEVVYVGRDEDYVPDSPRLQKQMGEWDGDE